MKKKIKKIILILFIILCSVILLVSGCMVYAIQTAKPHLYYDRGIDTIPESDYILVPGAKIFYNTPDLYLRHRLDFAYELYKEGKAPKIIISGAFDESVGKYENEVMKKYLEKLGVEPKDIISDLKGNSTYETLVRAKEYVGNRKVIFCTQEVYSYRAMYIANSIDLDMDVMCSDSVIYRRNRRNLVRESFSLIKAILNCTIMPIEVDSIEVAPFI